MPKPKRDRNGRFTSKKFSTKQTKKTRKSHKSNITSEEYLSLLQNQAGMKGKLANLETIFTRDKWNRRGLAIMILGEVGIVLGLAEPSIYAPLGVGLTLGGLVALLVGLGITLLT
jgi:hypothetical protein